MKIKRSDRLIDMTRCLLEKPHTIIPLTFFAQKYNSAKSSISEDLAIIKQNFDDFGVGLLETISGSAGGVTFIPSISKEEAVEFINIMAKEVSNEKRLLPGGYVYLSDLLGRPDVLQKVGRLIARRYINQKVDVVMTVATKGVPIAQSVSRFLNVPFVIVRRDSKITEGSTVSVNYVSGSSERIEKMELSKRSLKQGSNVLVVDDFMKGGGTVNGMKSMIEEFDSKLVGVAVFAEGVFNGKRAINDYTSLLRVDKINLQDRKIHVLVGNYFEKTF